MRPTVAVVVCAYTLERWDDLCLSLWSVATQSSAPEETLLVVDHNDLLLQRARTSLMALHPRLRVIANERKQGLSGARNTALEHAFSDIVVFLDDDAAAASDDWLDRILEPYGDPSVIAVGGAAMPIWSPGDVRPATLPAGESGRGELDWVVGCTYQGQPTSLEPVRNLMGCNMSFRREVFARAGGFGEHLGRVGKTPLGCEETELCIRARAGHPGSRVMFEPRALVKHHVSPDRLTWRYLLHRCYAEGLSKAAVTTSVGQDAALATERGYATKVLPAGVRRELRAAISSTESHRGLRLRGAVAIAVALVATGVGYLRGRLNATSVGAAAPAELWLQPEMRAVG